MLKSTSEIFIHLNQSILNGIKIPHGVSNLVIRKEGSKYYLAMFVFFYDISSITQGLLKRPELWILANIEDGSIIARYECKNKDFSSCSFDKTYKIESDKISTYNYNIRSMHIMDDIRRKIISEQNFDKKKYIKYLNLILKQTPEEYKRFYSELSNF